MSQNDIISAIESSVKFLSEFEKNAQHMHFGYWEEMFLKDTNKLIDENFNIKVENLKNFRGKGIFVLDYPSACLKSFYNNSKLYYKVKSLINLIIGNQRGKVKEALDFFKGVKEANYLDYLSKYPNPEIGRPLNLKINGYVFTWRYLRHIYFLGLFKQHLGNELAQDVVTVDIGSSYGIFSSLLKQEMPNSHHVLVDIPGQLILAHYYLSQLFPGAKIAGFKEVGKAERVDKDFIKQFDFVLVPTSMFDKMTASSVDLVTNFASFSEMSREWFEKYINSKMFKTAPLFYTVNRYDAYPTYDNNITVLDYPLKEYKTLHIRTCALFKNHYKGILFFLCKPVRYPSELFEFIGKRLNV